MRPDVRQSDSLASLLTNFDRYGQEIAVVTRHGVRKTRTQYGALASLARRFSMLLRDCGIGKGERVVIWGENGADWIAAFFGCIQLGVLPVPLDAAGSAAFAGESSMT